MEKILAHISHLFNGLNQRLGSFLCIMPLLLVLVQFTIVLLVYIFAIGSIKLQESLFYINGLMVMGAVGYTALQDGHVRVDIFYSKLSHSKKDWVNLLGNIFLLGPTLYLLWTVSIPYVRDSFSVFEGSTETGGLPFVYLLKATILLFCFSLTLAVVSNILTLLAKKLYPTNKQGDQ